MSSRRRRELVRRATARKSRSQYASTYGPEHDTHHSLQRACRSRRSHQDGAGTLCASPSVSSSPANERRRYVPLSRHPPCLIALRCVGVFEPTDECVWTRPRRVHAFRTQGENPRPRLLVHHLEELYVSQHRRAAIEWRTHDSRGLPNSVQPPATPCSRPESDAWTRPADGLRSSPASDCS